jgi:hypothetical protein
MRLILTVFMILAASGGVFAAEQRVVDSTGRVIGIILDCNSCKDPGDQKSCVSGVQEGYHDGRPCGECLMTANFGKKLMYPYDLQITGTLNQPDGKPLADEFVRLFLPNTWTVRTKTLETGFFRLMLGATEDRIGDVLKIDLGARSRPKVAGAPDYALYMLAENYKPCAEE